MTDLPDYEDYEVEEREATMAAPEKEFPEVLVDIETNAALGDYWRQGLADDVPEKHALSLVGDLKERKGSDHDWSNEKPLKEYYLETLGDGKRMQATPLPNPLPQNRTREVAAAEVRDPGQQQGQNAQIPTVAQTEQRGYPEIPKTAQPVPPQDEWPQVARALGFDPPFHGAGTWNFVKTLGGGAYGPAGLWVKYDRKWSIIDRTAVKESYLKFDQWRNKNYWYDERTPKDVYMHRALADLEHSAWSIVQFRGWKLYPDRFMYRIIMEYCSGGDLEGLIERHADIRTAKDENGDQLKSEIPDRAIWNIFEALAHAACLMRDGAQPKSTAPADWQGEMVHRDLKPPNIFLADPSPPLWRGIPKAKLGDFGLCIHRREEGVRNPEDVNIGTPSWCAPEQQNYRDMGVNFHAKYEITNAADVFSIGKSVLCLMARWSSKHENIAPSRYGLQPVTIPTAVWAKYPEKLVSLVQRCMEMIPDHRITARELLVEITKVVQDYGDEPFNGVPLKFGELEEDKIVMVEPDKYALFAR